MLRPRYPTDVQTQTALNISSGSSQQSPFRRPFNNARHGREVVCYGTERRVSETTDQRIWRTHGTRRRHDHNAVILSIRSGWFELFQLCLEDTDACFPHVASEYGRAPA